MQAFIPSVVSVIQALLKGPAWLLQKFISVFAGWNEALPSEIPLSSGVCSHSDSPYELHPSQRLGRVNHPHGQTLAPSQCSPYPLRPSRQSSTPYPTRPAPQAPPQHPPYPPLRQPSTLYSTKAAPQAPPQHPPYPPRRQPSTLYSTKTAPQALRDHDAPPPVAKPVKHTQQPPRHVTTVAPEAVVAPPATNPPSHEDPKSLRSKARCEGDQMAECFNQSQAAFVGNDKSLTKELSLKGQVHKENMMRLDKEASAKIFQENNKVCYVHIKGVDI
ncbi:DUF1771-domain-containing protein [Rhizopogon vinicolor AM-OR11-026]|uniref:DUF1771-domain-containing protein n=1 Tax=Rhizopogon vinicolor AM-OR11-026 TaxID=1314800 RepID=A0A1B7ML07_9AGAM|nr:DUF1771-domain-containing protein [Rhizopogon vinicolor AM-OR11-026]